MSESLVPGVRPRQVPHSLPRVSRGVTTRFRVDDQKGYLTTASTDEGGIGDVTIRMAKQGSTLAGMMDALGQAISLGLRAGAPLEVYLAKYANMRFAPTGMTDDRELPVATSLMDYVARRLAVDHLPVQRRAQLGILTTAEREGQADSIEGSWVDLLGDGYVGSAGVTICWGVGSHRPSPSWAAPSV